MGLGFRATAQEKNFEDTIGNCSGLRFLGPNNGPAIGTHRAVQGIREDHP